MRKVLLHSVSAWVPCMRRQPPAWLEPFWAGSAVAVPNVEVSLEAGRAVVPVTAAAGGSAAASACLVVLFEPAAKTAKKLLRSLAEQHPASVGMLGAPGCRSAVARIITGFSGTG